MHKVFTAECWNVKVARGWLLKFLRIYFLGWKQRMTFLFYLYWSCSVEFCFLVLFSFLIVCLSHLPFCIPNIVYLNLCDRSTSTTTNQKTTKKSSDLLRAILCRIILFLSLFLRERGNNLWKTKPQHSGVFDQENIRTFSAPKIISNRPQKPNRTEPNRTGPDRTVHARPRRLDAQNVIWLNLSETYFFDLLVTDSLWG